MQKIILRLLGILLLVSACGDNKPNPIVEIDRSNILLEENSQDNLATAYVIKNFEGGATGNTFYDIVLGKPLDVAGRLQMRMSAYSTAPEIEWKEQTLVVYYTDQVIWNFSNIAIFDNQGVASQYEIVLVKN